MHYFKDIIYRLQRGESERQIARDLGLSRPTVHKYKLKAEIEGYLKRDGVPELAELTATMGPAPQPPRIPSSLEPYQDIVQPMLEQGMEMTAMWQRLRDDHGYTGSYSSVRRYVHRQQPETPGSKAVIRVHTEPGEEMQVDFGGVGKLYDPKSGKVKTAYVFVATLCYSRHQYAELVFDQKTATWIGLHRRAFEHFGGVP